MQVWEVRPPPRAILIAAGHPASPAWEHGHLVRDTPRTTRAAIRRHGLAAGTSRQAPDRSVADDPAATGRSSRHRWGRWRETPSVGSRADDGAILRCHARRAQITARPS